MIHSINKISKRLGPERSKQAIAFIKEKKVKEMATLMLTYYDILYDRHIA
eukprot:Pgem_evm1s4500